MLKHMTIMNEGVLNLGIEVKVEVEVEVACLVMVVVMPIVFFVLSVTV